MAEYNSILLEPTVVKSESLSCTTIVTSEFLLCNDSYLKKGRTGFYNEYNFDNMLMGEIPKSEFYSISGVKFNLDCASFYDKDELIYACNHNDKWLSLTSEIFVDISSLKKKYMYTYRNVKGCNHRLM